MSMGLIRGAWLFALGIAAGCVLAAGAQGTGSVPGVTAVEANRELDGLAPYVARVQVSGVIRNFGNNYIPALMKVWENGFQRVQPGIRFETRLPGTEAAMAGLYGGTADLAFIGRESYPSEIAAFTETMGYAPLEIEISSGSFATPHKTFALMIFVHKDNPLAKLSLEEAARVFGCLGTPVTEWGQLGLKGEWEHRPVHRYGYTLETGMAQYFQRTVLGGTDRWAGNLREFDNGHEANGEVINARGVRAECAGERPGRDCVCQRSLCGTEREGSCAVENSR